MPVCGKSLSFAQPLQSPCPGSGHFQPQKSSLSPPEVASSAPQSGHLEAKTTVGNLKVAARKKENRGKMPPPTQEEGAEIRGSTLKRLSCHVGKTGGAAFSAVFRSKPCIRPSLRAFTKIQKRWQGSRRAAARPPQKSVLPCRRSGAAGKAVRPRRAKQAPYALFGSSDGQRHSLRAKKAK